MTKSNNSMTPTTRVSSFALPNGKSSIVENSDANKELGFVYINEADTVRICDSNGTFKDIGDGGTGDFSSLTVNPGDTNLAGLNVNGAIRFNSGFQVTSGTVTILDQTNLEDNLIVDGRTVLRDAVIFGNENNTPVTAFETANSTNTVWAGTTDSTNVTVEVDGSAVAGTITVQVGNTQANPTFAFLTQTAPTIGAYSNGATVSLTPADAGAALEKVFVTTTSEIANGAKCKISLTSTDPLQPGVLATWNYIIIGRSDTGLVLE